MAELLLADLLAWFPDLRIGLPDPDHAGRPTAAWQETPISWAIAARAGSPVLPALRGGEIVVLTRRTLDQVPVDLRAFAANLAATNYAALLLLGDHDDPGNLDRPWVEFHGGTSASALEGEINRLLTERRGWLYGKGTELGRVLVGALSSGRTLSEVVAAAARTVGIPMSLFEPEGSGVVPIHRDPPSTIRRVEVSGTDSRLALDVGPFRPEDRALAWLAADRVGESLETLLKRRSPPLSRVQARANRLNHLMLGRVGAETAYAIGLNPTSRFRVALGSDPGTLRDVERRLGPGGGLIEAETVDGHVLGLFEWASGVRPPEGLDPRLFQAIASPRWIAFSEETSLVQLGTATEQARFTAALLAAGEIEGPVVAFDAIARIGAFRLLFHLRDDPEVERFAKSVLDELDGADRRGVLRDTLRVYLASGGAGVETAARLNIHRNTLSYRLRRIAAITGQDPTDPRCWLPFGLALAVERLPRLRPVDDATTPNDDMQPRRRAG